MKTVNAEISRSTDFFLLNCAATCHERIETSHFSDQGLWLKLRLFLSQKSNWANDNQDINYLPFWGVWGAEHTPLRWLQRARTWANGNQDINYLPFWGVWGAEHTPLRWLQRARTWANDNQDINYLPFWGVWGAEHTPLRWLQGARTAHFPCLLKLARDSRHHAETGYIGETRQYLGHTRTVHLKSLYDPVSL